LTLIGCGTRSASVSSNGGPAAGSGRHGNGTWTESDHESDAAQEAAARRRNGKRSELAMLRDTFNRTLFAPASPGAKRRVWFHAAVAFYERPSMSQYPGRQSSPSVCAAAAKRQLRVSATSHPPGIAPRQVRQAHARPPASAAAGTWSIGLPCSHVVRCTLHCLDTAMCIDVTHVHICPPSPPYHHRATLLPVPSPLISRLDIRPRHRDPTCHQGPTARS
jgi:hypothetical protein